MSSSPLSFLLVGVIALGLVTPATAKTIVLDGQNLTPAHVAAIANDLAQIQVLPAAAKRNADAYLLLLTAAKEGQEIYGLTTGVGENKDQSEAGFDDGVNACTIPGTPVKVGCGFLKVSTAFNRDLIYTQSAGVSPDAPVARVRAAMAIRLNTMLFGGTAVEPKVIEQLTNFLNRGITPVMPGRGSLGEADITLLGHLGLAMIGVGDVDYKGKRTAAKAALAAEGLPPLSPLGKDALGIFSSNAYSAAITALLIDDLDHLRALAVPLFALSLEALNGNVSPFLRGANANRPYPYVNAASKEIRTLLGTSYLMDQWDRKWQPEEGESRLDPRALQDPLSYRTFANILGTLDEATAHLKQNFLIQLNSSDDNPTVVLGEKPQTNKYQETKLYADGNGVHGTVNPSANFSPLPWVVPLQSVGIALGHYSSASANRTIKLAMPQFTYLPRFLGVQKGGHAFGAIQKVFVSLAAENRELANPVSLDFIPVAGSIEDTATNAPRAARRASSGPSHQQSLRHSRPRAPARRASRRHPSSAIRRANVVVNDTRVAEEIPRGRPLYGQRPAPNTGHRQSHILSEILHCRARISRTME